MRLCIWCNYLYVILVVVHIQHPSFGCDGWTVPCWLLVLQICSYQDLISLGRSVLSSLELSFLLGLHDADISLTKHFVV